MSKRKGPSAHTWSDGGGMVLRCDDVEQARTLMVEAYLEDQCNPEADDFDSPEEYAEWLAELFPVSKARQQRGRMLGALTNSYAAAEGWSWSWWPHSERQSERGTTVAWVWSDDR